MAETTPRAFLVLLLTSVLPASPQVTDSRCYLESGGSAESFFVSEDLPVGSVIGSLRIIGDPSELTGDVVLRLKEVDSPVRIYPGSKNISLARRLDKEGIEGPASVYVNVICDRKRTVDPAFVIPVNIRVTDANDNAPQFVNAPYMLNISEVTVVGTRVLQGIQAVDADQQGPYSTVQYSVLPGKHAEYFVFVNGLEGTLLLRKPLDYELLSNFSVTIRAQDQGSPPRFSDTTLYVNVIDADDQNPRFFDDRYTATLPDRPVAGSQLRVSPRDIAAYDQDVGINADIYYTFNSGGGDYRFFDMDRLSGRVLVRRSVPDEELLQPATLVVRATQVDNQDRYALATLTVGRLGAPSSQLQFLQRTWSAGALENSPVGGALLTVVTNRPRDKRLRFWLDDPNGESRFAVSASGDVLLRRPLDFEAEDRYAFLVHVSDGRANDSALVNISVLNVNDWDPRFRYPQYEFFAEAGVAPGDVVGRVEAADGDRGDSVTISLAGPAARMFYVTESGDIVVSDISSLNTSTVHLVAVATDSGVPPRQASAPVIVHFPEAMVTAAAGDSWLPGGSSFVMLVLFGSLLALLALVVVLLLLYIYKHKRSKAGARSGAKLPGFVQHEKLPPSEDPGSRSGAAGKMDNPVFGQDGGPYTATVKGLMARGAAGCNNPLAKAGKRKVSPAPQPPQLPGDGGAADGDGGNLQQQQQPGLELEPGTPPAEEERVADQTNLTVYF
ncbi:protocadherin Fat 4 [Bacillus rossius redtenbacheri]|uniref:protocadherin Fat 4 n=1 Tax=Bacillus rossius redtenbacheri TaxID=93214 RepID=UPI002FDEF644